MRSRAEREPEDLDAAAHSGDNYYGTAPMSPFMGNQDVPRFLSTAANMLDTDPKAQAWSDPRACRDGCAYAQRAGLTFLYTQPGVPLVYTATATASSVADPDNRRMMKWTGLTSREATARDGGVGTAGWTSRRAARQSRHAVGRQ